MAETQEQLKKSGPEEKKEKPKRSAFKEIAIAVFLAILIRGTLVQAYHIPSGSMEDTLLEGDYVLGDKLTFGTQIPDRIPFLNTKLPSFRLPGFFHPKSGDMVIFEFPQDASRDFIKRCVATEGQTVEVKDKVVYVDGKPFENPAAVKHEDPRVLGRQYGPRDNFGPYTVPPGNIFVMGDNRDSSYDSRFWGTVPLEKVKAHPLLIYYSWDSEKPLSNIFSKVRWWRLGLLH